MALRTTWSFLHVPPLSHLRLFWLQRAPVGQSLSTAQGAEQRPSVHEYPVAQSALPLHDEGHAAIKPSQTLPVVQAASLPLGRSVQVPGVPEHVSQASPHSVSQQKPSEQKRVTQSVAAAHDDPIFVRHEPVESHVEDPEHVSSSASVTSEHTPGDAAVLHVLQDPSHAVLQQTPS